MKQDGPTNKPTLGVGEKNPNNVLNNIGKDPSISDGKNHSSRRSESSSEAGSSTKAPSPGQPGFIGPLTEAHTKAIERAKTEREQPIATEPKQSESPNSGVWCAKFSTGVGGTPNPENDSGDGHASAIVMQKRTPKTIEQLEQEKRRQVTLPGEGRSNHEVHADQKETLQEGQRHRTDGRIDPAPNDDGTTTSTGPRTVKPGFGTERVDGRPGHKPGGGLTTPGQPAPSGGTTPDNPTADDPSDDDSDRNAA